MGKTIHCQAPRHAGLSRLSLILTISVLLLVCFVAAIFLAQPKAPVVPIPNPNAAETLAEASAAVVGLDELLQGEQSLEEMGDVAALRVFVDANAKAIEKFQLAAQQDCVPIVDYEEGLTELLDGGVGDFRNAGYSSRAAARLAQLEERFNDAAKHYADLYSVAARYGEHGCLVHVQASLAVQRLALQSMLDLATSLDEETKAQIRNRIEQNRPSVDFEDVAARERVLANNEHGAFQASYMRMVMGNAFRESETRTKEIETAVLQMRDELLEKL